GDRGAALRGASRFARRLHVGPGRSCVGRCSCSDRLAPAEAVLDHAAARRRRGSAGSVSASLVAMAIAAGLATSNVPIESVSLHAGNGSRVAGRLTYHAAGQGTAVSVRISGLAPGASVRVLFEAGAC